ncbi:hypothetical protein BH23GEM11_BH23GEM11_09160 [soil metagenome]
MTGAPRSGLFRPAVLPALVAILMTPPPGLQGQQGDPPSPPRPASADTLQARGDTLRTRADSVRARVLDRIREQSAPVVRDTMATGTVPPGTRPPTTPPVRPGAAARPGTSGQPKVSLPSGAESVMQELARLPGFNPAPLEGARADYAALERQLVLWGDATDPEARVPARFYGQGVRVEADTSVAFDDRSGRVRTRGATLLTPDRGDPVLSRTLIYDVATSRGTALGAETTYSEGGGEWIVRGDLDSVEDGRIYGSRTRFTSDDRPVPHSYFAASELKVLANQILVARNVRLHFADVPVAWLPFLAQPLQSGRQSGILTPRFSVNDIVRTSGGYQRRLSNVGLYWAMSDYSDATLAADWWSGQYTALTGNVRFRWAERFMQGELSARRFWRETGARDLALSTRNNWEPTERTRLSASGNYVSNTRLVTQNSLDPRELTSSINSQAGVQQRFDWGSLSVEARRQQYLSDDRLEMTLPSATLSLNSFTLFREAPNQARWYNNMTASASSRFGRDVREFPSLDVGDAFRFNRTDQVRTTGNGRASLSLGNLSLGANADYRESAFSGVPESLARPRAPFPIIQPGDELDEFGRSRLEYSDAEVRWSASVGYQQRLIGTSSITPSLSLGGQMVRVDSIAEARNFVEGPTRLAFGVGLQTEVFGFFPGVGGFDAIRHKLTPQFNYSYAPAITPTDLQRRVFGARELGVQNQFTFGVNQTFEARVQEPPPPAPGALRTGASPAGPGDVRDEDPGAAVDPDAPDREAVDREDAPLPQDGIPPGGDDPPAPGMEEPRTSVLDDDELQRPPPSRVVTLLALSTQALAYDLVRADSTGQWLDGFTTLQLRNTVRSDYLRGLDFSFTHDLWQDPDSIRVQRAFSPHLSQLALGFSLDSNTRILRSLGRLLGVMGDGDGAPRGTVGDPREELEFDEPADGFDDNRVLPGLSGRGRSGMTSMRRDGWNARLNYALRRPRDGVLERSQMLNGTVSFQPTNLLSVSWTTAYDIEEQRFSDHMVTVMRDMYDWEATFGFRQAVNGNWTFRFEVSLKANRDLRFDHETRNLDATGGDRFFTPDAGF